MTSVNETITQSKKLTHKITKQTWRTYTNIWLSIFSHILNAFLCDETSFRQHKSDDVLAIDRRVFCPFRIDLIPNGAFSIDIIVLVHAHCMIFMYAIVWRWNSHPAYLSHMCILISSVKYISVTWFLHNGPISPIRQIHVKVVLVNKDFHI